MERQLAHLIEGLLGRGHTLTVIARRCELRKHERLRFVRVIGPGRPFAVAFPWFLIIASLKAHRHRRQLLHTTGALVLNRADVVTVHFCNEALHDRDVTQAKRDTILYRANDRVALWMSRTLERLLYKPSRVRRLVAVSRGVAAELDRFFPSVRGRTDVIPNAVDPAEFRPDPKAAIELRARILASPDQLLAVHVAGDWERKGLRHALEGLANAPRWALLVVGSGDRARFSRLARELGVVDRVHFKPPTKDIAQCYQAGDAFVFPTSYEAFPMVVLEAAASGLPLLVTRVNGVEEILEDGVNGWFIDRDGDSVARGLKAVENLGSKRTEMAAAARTSALRFGWNEVVDSYERLYLSLADVSAAGAAGSH
jgi:UDP-glucose:(heptosyl)LPS alpha-1,3-glucosyltransferase